MWVAKWNYKTIMDSQWLINFDECTRSIREIFYKILSWGLLIEYIFRMRLMHVFFPFQFLNLEILNRYCCKFPFESNTSLDSTPMYTFPSISLLLEVISPLALILKEVPIANVELSNMHSNKEGVSVISSIGNPLGVLRNICGIEVWSALLSLSLFWLVQ